MSGDKSTSIPIAAAGVVALLVSAAFLSQHAFDLLRLGESDAAKQGQVLQPPVEARLWEDPLAALARHRAKLKEKCTPTAAKEAGATVLEVAAAVKQAAVELRESLRSEKNGETVQADVASKADDTAAARDPVCDGGAAASFKSLVELREKSSDLTVIAALLPGADFVGVEEMRRRSRYALLAGLAAEGFVPDNSERIGYFKPELCDGFTACDNAFAIDVVYETLTAAKAPQRRAVVLWVSDVTIGQRWLSRLTLLLAKIVRPHDRAKLRIVGPRDSDKLLGALAEDLDALAWQAADLAGPPFPAYDQFLNHWRILARTTLVSPWSTTSAKPLRDEVQRRLDDLAKSAGVSPEQLPDCAPDGPIDCLDEVFRSRLDHIAHILYGLFPHVGDVKPVSSPFFVRTVATDDQQIKLLAEELCVRGLSGDDQRVVLLHEWDSIYARTFAESLRQQLKTPTCGEALAERNVKIYAFLRGIDGANLDGGTKEVRLVPRAGADKGRDANKEPAIEWPESRDQRDYVRRLAREIQKQAAHDRVTVAAIGMFGVDVHDKLVLAQALRETFPDRPLFTTDLDARLLHPDVLSYTRNMIVASSLPLTPPPLKNDIPAVFSLLSTPSDVEQSAAERVTPFRDAYQTATFFAARYAAAAKLHMPHMLPDIRDLLKQGRLFEIGRHGEVELGIKTMPSAERRERRGFAWASAGVLLVVGFLILFSRRGPAMKAAFDQRRTASTRLFVLSTAVLCAITVGALGFAAGVVLDLAWPGTTGWWRSLLLAAVCALVFFVLIYPGYGRRPVAPSKPKWQEHYRWRTKLWRRSRAVHVCVALAAVVAMAAVLEDAPGGEGMREPFGAANGVSAWPSQLLRTLAVVLFAWFLDRAWNGGVLAAQSIGLRFFAFQPDEARRCRLRPARWWPQPKPAVRPRPQTLPAPVEIPLPAFPQPVLASAGARIGGQAAQPSMAETLDRPSASWLWRWRRRGRRWGRMLAAGSLWFWQPKLAWTHDRGGWEADNRVDGRRLWRAYFLLLRNNARLCRLVVWMVATVLLIWWIMMLMGIQQPYVPVRGVDDRASFYLTILLSAFGTIALLVLVSNAAVLTLRFILILKQGRTIYLSAGDSRPLRRRAWAADSARPAALLSGGSAPHRPRPARRRGTQLAVRSLDRRAAAGQAYGGNQSADCLSLHPARPVDRGAQPLLRQLGRRLRHGAARHLSAMGGVHGGAAQLRRRDRPPQGGRGHGARPAVAAGGGPAIQGPGRPVPAHHPAGARSARGCLRAVLRAATGARHPGALGRRGWHSAA
jgi:hypothetical protein